MKKSKFSSAAMAEAGMAIALTGLLHMITIYQMPQGGRVTAAAMVPLIFLSLRRGPGVGMLAGTVFGLFNYIQDPFFVHPVQFLLDYPVPFMLLGLAGCFRRWPAVGVVVAIAARFASHVVSGAVFFASYAPKGMNPWAYSAVYNATYLVPELIVTVVVIVALWSVPAMGRGARVEG